MCDAVEIAKENGIKFSRKVDGWYWSDGEWYDNGENNFLNGPFCSEEDAVEDFISGADNI